MFTFRQTINQTLNSHLLDTSEELADSIIQKYEQARLYLAKTLEKEAQEKIAAIQQQQEAVENNIETYNQAILEINLCLETMLLDRKKLPEIQKHDLALILHNSENSDNDQETYSEI
jgi:hypothetical protein